MRNRMLIWLLLGGGAFVLLVIVVLAVVLTYWRQTRRRDFAFGDRIQVVDIEGELVDSRPIHRATQAIRRLQVGARRFC